MPILKPGEYTLSETQGTILKPGEYTLSEEQGTILQEGEYTLSEPKGRILKPGEYTLSSDKPSSLFSQAADLASAVPGAVKAGVAQIGVGALGIGEATTQALGFDSAEKWFDELGDDIKSFQTSVLPKDLDKNKAKYYISGIFQNLATNLPMLALGPIGALAGMASVAGGSKFDEMDDKGYSTTQSILGGIGQGLIEAGTEMLPVGVLFKKMPLAKKAIKTALADLVGEEIATVSEYVMDKYGFNEKLTPADLKQRIIDTIPIALGSGGLMGATVGVIDKLTAKQKAGLTIELKNELQKPPVQDTATTKLPEVDVDLSLLQDQAPQPAAESISTAQVEQTTTPEKQIESIEDFKEQRPAIAGLEYHGSPEGDLALADPYYYTKPWSEGVGFYTTEDRDVAKEYSKGRTARGKRKKSAKETGSINYIKNKAQKVLDMDAPIDTVFWKKVSDVLDVDFPSGVKTNNEARLEMLSDYSHENQISADETVTFMNEILEENGYDATSHTEGLKKGTPHKVHIFLTKDAFEVISPEQAYAEYLRQKETGELPLNKNKVYNIINKATGTVRLKRVKGDMVKRYIDNAKDEGKQYVAEETMTFNEELAQEKQTAPESAPIGGQRTFGTIQPDGTVGTPEKVGNIRLFGHDANGVRVDRIENADDISKILHMTYEANKQQIDEATRGRQSSEQMVLLAHEMGMTESQLLKRLKGQAYNSEEAYAARMVLHSSAQQLNEFVAEMGDNPTEQNIAIFRALMAKHAAVQAQVAGIAAEAGRALRQFNETAKGAKESLDLANKLVAEFGGKEFNLELLKKAEIIMQTGDMKAINQFFEQAVEAKTSDKLYEIWINSILSNPATHMANVMSNALTYVSSLVERGVVPAVEFVRSRVTGQKQQRFLGETKAYAIGTMGGFLDAVKVMHQVLKTGVSQFGQGKVEGFNEMGAIKGKKGKLVRTPTRMLQAADDFAKTLVYRSELNALAYRQARIEGKTGAEINTRMQEILSANPKTDKMLKDMQEKAHYQAKYRTFTKALGVEKDAIQGLRKIPGMRYAIPFTRTPTNIAKYGIERTPLGFLKLFRQDIKTAEWSDEFAAPLVGTAVMAFAYTLAKSGLITGSGPKDKDEREALYRTGWQPNSVNLQAFGGEDAWLRIDRFEPISSLLNMAADVAEQKFDKDTDFSDVFAAAAFSISRNLASKTFLSGLSNLMDAVSDPQRYGDNYVKMMAGSVIPGLIAGATRAIEPDLKITKTPTDAIKERIPGLRDSLYSRRDIWGNKIERAGGTGAGGVATRYLFGTGVSPVSQDLADLEMVRLGVNKGVPSNKLTIFREQVEMTPAEYDEFQIIAGAEAKRRVDRIAKFDFRSDEAKAKKIKSAIDKARDKARNFIARKIKIRLTKEKQ